MTIGWAVVGCGWAAGDMCDAVAAAEGARIVVVRDRDLARADAFAARYDAKRAASFEELLEVPDVDVVYVALPHRLLEPTAARAIAAGKHVLVEKPMALDVAGVHSLAAAASTRGVVAAPVFELRARPIAEEARSVVQSGSIGEVRAVRIRTVIDKPQSYWSTAPWRARRADAGGGILLMNAIHQLDLLRYVTGLEYESVVADIATLHADVEVEDSGAAIFRLANGALVSLTAAAHSPGAVHEERIEIDGALGRLDLPDPSSDTAAQLRLYSGGAWSERTCTGAGAYVTFVDGFLDAVRGVAQPPATPQDAAAALGAVAAVYRAAAEGVRVAVER
ncbi:MAG TPA: Gfo/Idh/MocA family oxidoreductase [Gaiellaceae bacterium]|jgi:predicted dehydrogenase